MMPAPRDVKVPERESPMRPYQRTDCDRVLNIFDRRAAAFLGHEPGLGKTLIALCIAEALGARRIVVACPALARLVWANEIKSWFPAWASRVVIVRPGIEPMDLRAKLAASDLILVLSYDFIGGLDLASKSPLDDVVFGNARFDLLICDEAHYLKSVGAMRTKRLYRQGGIAQRSKKVLLLSGTPAPNGAHELWTHFRALWPDLITMPSHHGKPRPLSEIEWSERVTNLSFNKWGLRRSGVKNPRFVRDKLDQVMVRRTKREVLPELPRVIAADVPLDLDPAKTWARLTMEARHLNAMLMSRFAKQSDATILKELVFNPGSDESVALSTLRRQLARAKLEATVDWLCPRLENDVRKKIVVFGWHVAVLDRLHSYLLQYSPVILTGATRDNERKHAIERFQHDPECRVFVGQLAACGTAVTLTAGQECDFLECAWTPAVNEQAIARLHRMGQQETVNANFLYAPDTLDEIVMRTFRRKARDIKTFILT